MIVGVGASRARDLFAQAKDAAPSIVFIDELVDDELRRLTDSAYQDALSLLRDHRAQPDLLAAALLAKETLDEANAYAAAGLPHPRHDIADELVREDAPHPGIDAGLQAPAAANGQSSNPHNPSTAPSPGTQTLEVDNASQRSPS